MQKPLRKPCPCMYMTVEPEAALKVEILDQSPSKTLAFESWKTHSAQTRSLDGSLHVKVSMVA